MLTSYRIHQCLCLLIMLNVAVYVWVQYLEVFFEQKNDVFLQSYFLSHSLQELSHNPFTLLTYGFVHTQFLHLFLNMLLLYLVGRICINLSSVWVFLRIYVLGIIFGGLSFVLSYAVFRNVLSQNTVLIGASAGVMAVAIFLCGFFPHYKLKLFQTCGVPLWVLGLLLLSFDALSMSFSNTAGHVAHLGGGVFGLLFAFYRRKHYAKAK